MDQLANVWLSCVIEDKHHTWIGQKLPEQNFPLTPATSALVTPDHGKTTYFVDTKTQKKYLIDETDSRLSDWTLAFQNRIGYPVESDPQWVDLFPSGTPLKSWSYSDIPNAGAPATTCPVPSKDANLTIGTVIEQTTRRDRSRTPTSSSIPRSWRSSTPLPRACTVTLRRRGSSIRTCSRM